ncbi:uncharacterized protein [Nicotiana tomentosiformis]|uniref:uncharacterized protein n=1 Tax=Nicotiana tomentosiformis TaxID=4098 RepID=UPI00388C58FA
MAGDDDNMDLAVREVAQQREKDARDTEEAAIKDAHRIYEEKRGHKLNQNQHLDAAQFGNIAPGSGRPLGDYAGPVYNQGLSRKMKEDPNTHLMDFDEIMNTFQNNGVSQDVVYLMAFPFTLKDDAKQWLRSLHQGSIRIWEEMTRKFLDKYFSSAKTVKFRRDIHNFCQKDIETVFEAWESFKEIVRKCQHSGIELWMQLQDFWDGLTPASSRTLSNAAGGPLMKKTPEKIVTILDELSEDANQWPSGSAERRRVTGVYQVDANTYVQVQLDAMAKEIRKLTLASIQSETHIACDICGRGHPTFECQASIEEVNAVGNYNFNAMGQRHPDFSWSSPGVNAVTLRSGQVLKDPTPIQKEVVPKKEIGEQLKNEVDKKKKGKNGAEKKKKEETSRREESNEDSKHMPALPFPQKLKLENEIGEIRSAPISLELADQTTLILEGIVEDVLVRVDKFVFPVDFIVVNMEENKEAPLILGRPFLVTGRAIFDINDRKLLLRVGKETVTFEMNVETGVRKDKSAASVEWKVKSSKGKAALSEKDKCGVYPKKVEKKLSTWMCALVRRCGMDLDFNSDPD